METIGRLIEEKPAVIFSRSPCCISYSMIKLITRYGAHPSVYKLDQLPNGSEIDKVLQKLGCKPSVPAVFIGKRLVGGANNVISLQVQGKLVPIETVRI